MLVNHYRIHFINGQAINVAECVEDEDNITSDLIERFMEALPEGVLRL